MEDAILNGMFGVFAGLTATGIVVENWGKDTKRLPDGQMFQLIAAILVCLYGVSAGLYFGHSDERLGQLVMILAVTVFIGVVIFLVTRTGLPSADNDLKWRESWRVWLSVAVLLGFDVFVILNLVFLE